MFGFGDRCEYLIFFAVIVLKKEPVNAGLFL